MLSSFFFASYFTVLGTSDTCTIILDLYPKIVPSMYGTAVQKIFFQRTIMKRENIVNLIIFFYDIRKLISYFIHITQKLY